MKIFECSPFFCENLVADIKIENSKGFVDQMLILESDRTFQYDKKEYCFENKSPNVTYLRFDGTKSFRKPHWGPTRKFPFLRWKPTGWINESIQRNAVAEAARELVKNDDIVVLSDIDEIVDWRHHDAIVDAVKKHGIITIRLHFTCYYFDLHSVSFSGPPDYSYRVFLLRGDVFHSLKYSSDELRKAGEKGSLMETIFCPEEIMGFHHSWLGDVDFVIRKLRAYSHVPKEHDVSISKNNVYQKNRIRELVLSGKSLFDGHQLELMDFPPLLPGIDPSDIKYRDFFLARKNGPKPFDK